MSQTNGLLSGVVEYGLLVAGVLGSAVSLSYMKELTTLRAFTAVAAGTATAYYVAPLGAHLANLPDFQNPFAFLIGLATMRAIPAFLDQVDKLRDIKLPWSK